jgi:hypothetical protein
VLLQYLRFGKNFAGDDGRQRGMAFLEEGGETIEVGGAGADHSSFIAHAMA